MTLVHYVIANRKILQVMSSRSNGWNAKMSVFDNTNEKDKKSGVSEIHYFNFKEKDENKYLFNKEFYKTIWVR